MTKAAIILAAAFTLCFSLNAQESGSDWETRFRLAFHANLGERPFALSPEDYIEDHSAAFMAAIEAGMDPAELGQTAADAFSRYDMDLRGGLSLQQAKARSVQTFSILSRSALTAKASLKRLGEIRRKDDTVGKSAGRSSAALFRSSSINNGAIPSSNSGNNQGHGL